MIIFVEDMKRTILQSLLLPLLLAPVWTMRAEQADSTAAKSGYGFLALPLAAFDADKGIQYGAFANLFDYGDGSLYPNYASKTYFEASLFTKGSQQYFLMYDNKKLIPGVRWSTSFVLSLDKALDFYGFNGYSSWYDHDRVALGKANADGPQDQSQYLYSPYYKVARNQFIGKTDFIGRLGENLYWEAGYHFRWIDEGEIDRISVNDGKADYNRFPDSEPTLFENYRNWGLITDDEADGGFYSSLRLGLVYDSRDKEGAPTKGIWAEGHLMLAPKWLGTTNPFWRYSLTMRQYFPIIGGNRLTFAYRLNYEGNFGNSAPYYVLPFITLMGESCDRDGMGGYRTVRGIMRNKVVGLDMASYVAELRWRFYDFSVFGQNLSLGLSVFSDGTMVTRGRDMSFRGEEEFRASYDAYMQNGTGHDRPHITAGAGFRIILNENFILALEGGVPLSRFYPASSPLYKQDGNGAFYINSGYLF
mgnify:FL=1